MRLINCKSAFSLLYWRCSFTVHRVSSPSTTKFVEMEHEHASVYKNHYIVYKNKSDYFWMRYHIDLCIWCIEFSNWKHHKNTDARFQPIPSPVVTELSECKCVLWCLMCALLTLTHFHGQKIKWLYCFTHPFESKWLGVI